MNVLFIGVNVYPVTDANGNCILAVAERLQKKGVNIHIVADTIVDGKDVCYNLQGIKVYNIKKNFFDKCMCDYVFSKIIRYVYKIIQLPFYPIDKAYTYYRLYKIIKELDKKHHFHAIVSVFQPMSSLFLGGWLKQRKKLILYMLDTLVYYIPPHRVLPNWFIKKRFMQIERWIYKKADLIINMQNYKSYYKDNVKFDCFESKMRYVDFPLFTPTWEIDKSKNYFNNGKLNISFMGSLYPEFRNPAYVLKVMSPILDEENSILHFFSRGEEDVINDYSNKCTCIESHGFVSREIANEVKLSTDIFINIANNGVNMVPSKIFEYMSYGKRIIHFYHGNEDTCIPYLKKYPYVLIINEMDDFYNNQKKIKDFMKIQIDLNKLGEILKGFKMNTPEYTANIIMEELNK